MLLPVKGMPQMWVTATLGTSQKYGTNNAKIMPHLQKHRHSQSLSHSTYLLDGDKINFTQEQ